MKRSLTFFVLLMVGCVIVAGCGAPADAPSADAPLTPPLEATAADADAATATPPVQAPGEQAVLSVVLESDAVSVGDTVVATVLVDNAQDLFGLEAHLAYDGDLLSVVDTEDEVEGVQIESGSLLDIEYIVQNQCDDTQGLIDYAASQMPPSEGVTGDGEIARVTFRAIASGTAELKVLSVVLASSEGQSLPVALPSEATVVVVK